MKKILVVDDENLMLFSLTAMFKDAEVDVMTAATGHDALQAIGRNRFDLCFLDIHLPDMNGLDIMMQLRTRSRETRIAMMTGGEVTGAMMESIRSNADLLLSKPFDLLQVKTLVDRILTNGRPSCYEEQGASTDDQDSGIQWVAVDVRKQVRRPENKHLAYLAVPSPPAIHAEVRSGQILDVSENGLGLVAACPHETGSVIRFMHGSAWCTGIVRWSARTGVHNEYRTGVWLAAAGSAPDEGQLLTTRQ